MASVSTAYGPPSTTNRARVLGSGFTLFFWGTTLIPFAQQVSLTTPQPVGPGPVAIQPIDEPYPLQVVTPQAAGMGSLTLSLYELYGSKVWERLDPLTFKGAADIVDLFVAMAQLTNEVNVHKIIKPPVIRGATPATYVETFHGCVITNVVDGEQVEVGSMEALKQITIGFRYMTNNISGTAGGAGYKFRDAPIDLAADQANIGG